MIQGTNKKQPQSMVQALREIRDAVSAEIKDMTFAEERAYLDNLLKNEKADKIKTPAKEKSTPVS